MIWRCKHCGFEIPKREDRRRIRIKDEGVYIFCYCDNCLNWSIMDRIPIDKLRKHIIKEIK